MIHLPRDADGNEYIGIDEIIKALKIAKSKLEAAKLLDRTPRWLYTKMAEYGIDPLDYVEDVTGPASPHTTDYRARLHEILSPNNRLNVKRNVLVRDLIAEKLFDPECEKCAARECGKVDVEYPLVICPYDGNFSNLDIDNIYLLCFTCAFVEFGYDKIKRYIHIRESEPRPRIKEWDHMRLRRRKKGS